MPRNPAQRRGRGRGAVRNPPNRFEPIRLERDPDWNPEEDPAPTTQFLRDRSRTVISSNDSPDIPYRFSLNPYRGCEHGCAYCYARPTHEYLGFSSGLDFETRIMVKEDAPGLLRRELASPKWKPEPLAMSGVTDPYQPVERRLEISRRCLEVLAEFRQPVMIVTKNRLVTRDLDLLTELARHRAVTVSLSLTTLDPELARRLEPRTSQPAHRLAAIETLARAGVPVGVLAAPVIPALNDHEIPGLLKAASAAGARWAYYQILRLPHALRELFCDWLEEHYPRRKEKILGRLRALRGGRLNDSRFGSRMSGEGRFADQIEALFKVACRQTGLDRSRCEPSSAAFRRPTGRQMDLFPEPPG